MKGTFWCYNDINKYKLEFLVFMAFWCRACISGKFFFYFFPVLSNGLFFLLDKGCTI